MKGGVGSCLQGALSARLVVKGYDAFRTGGPGRKEGSLRVCFHAMTAVLMHGTRKSLYML